MDTFDEKSIKAQLDKMHLCVNLEEEDRKLGRTKERNLDFEKNKEEVYKAYRIELLDLISLDIK